MSEIIQPNEEIRIQDGSKVDLVKDSIRMILDMIKIRYLHRNIKSK